MPTGNMGADTDVADSNRLSAEAGALLRRVGRWNTEGWAARTDAGRRSDVVFALVQSLADSAAGAENRPAPPVPRLDDGVLPDQLAVMVRDVLATGSTAAARSGLAAVRRAHATLFG